MPVISACNNPAEWTGRTTNISIDADTEDYVSSPASIRAVSIGNEWQIWLSRYVYPFQDWRSDPILRPNVKVSNNTYPLALSITYVVAGLQVSERYTISGLESNVWKRAVIDLRNPGEMRGEVPDLSAVVGIALVYTLRNASGTLKVDQIETESEVPPPPPPPPIQTHTLTVNSTPEGVQFNIIIGGNTMSYPTPWSQSLKEGTYEITVPSTIQIGSDLYTFVKWDDGSTSPVRTVNLTAETTIEAIYTKVQPPPPGKGYIDVHAIYNSAEVAASGALDGTAFTTPATLEVDPGHYVVQVTYNDITQEKAVDIVEGQTVRLDFNFAPFIPPWLSFWNSLSTPKKVAVVGVPIIVIAGLLQIRK